jgi:hypothetical protein
MQCLLCNIGDAEMLEPGGKIVAARGRDLYQAKDKTVAAYAKL